MQKNAYADNKTINFIGLKMIFVIINAAFI